MITRRTSPGVALAVIGALTGCGDGAPSGDTSAAAAKLPSSRGEVWAVDPASPSDAQVLAFLNGVHTFVRQGTDIYTATTRLKSVQADGAVAAAQLEGGLQVRIEEQGAQPILVFSSGPRAPLRKYEAPEEKR